MTDTERRRAQGADAKRSLVEAIVARRTEKFATGTVYLDGAAWSEAEALRTEAVEARRVDLIQSGTNPGAYSLESDIPGLERRLMERLAALEASAVVFTFHALPADAYDELVNAYPSTDPDLLWNDDFPAALIAATCQGVEGPDEIAGDSITVDEVEALQGVFDKAQFAVLFRATNELQVKPPAPFTYAAIATIPVSEQKSTTASGNGESRTPGS